MSRGVGERQLTRKQRVKIAALLIEAARAASPATVATNSAAKAQLAHGLAALTEGKYDHKRVLAPGGLADALKDQSTVDVPAAAAAWELAVWPQPAPANKKANPEAAPAAELVGA